MCPASIHSIHHGEILCSKQTIWDASLAAVCQRIRYLTSVCPHGACHLLPHGRCDLPLPEMWGGIGLRHIAPSGRSRSPARREKKGEKKKNGRCRVCPCIPTLSHFFLLLHFVVQHHLISAFTYGAYSSFIAHSFSGQYRQFLAKGHSRRSALDIQRDTVDVLTPKCRAIALMRQPHSKYSLKYSTVCSFTLPPPPGRMSPARRRTPPQCIQPLSAPLLSCVSK